jgi:hypothetical protein
MSFTQSLAEETIRRERRVIAAATPCALRCIFLCVLCVKKTSLYAEPRRGSYTQRTQSYLLEYPSAQTNPSARKNQNTDCDDSLFLSFPTFA